LKVMRSRWAGLLLLILMTALSTAGLTYAYYALTARPIIFPIPQIDNFTIDTAIYQPAPALWVVKAPNMPQQVRALLIVICHGRTISAEITSNSSTSLGVVPAGACVVFLRVRVGATAYVTSSNLRVVVYREPVLGW